MLPKLIPVIKWLRNVMTHTSFSLYRGLIRRKRPQPLLWFFPPYQKARGEEGRRNTGNPPKPLAIGTIYCVT